MEPRIQYAKTSDGVNIAFTVFGEGPPFVIPPALVASHLQLEWEMPGRRETYERMAERATVVRYDPRGVGMSQGEALDFTLEQSIRDLEAMLDALGLEQFALYDRSSNGDVPLAYAAQHPERVTHLVIFGSLIAGIGSSLQRAMSSILPLAEEQWELFSNVSARLFAGWDSPDATPMAALIRASHSARTFRAAYEATQRRDPLAFAAKVRVPTLIVHPLNDRGMPVSVTSLAAVIDGARAIGIPGDRVAAFPNAAGIAAIHDFISATPTSTGQPIAAPELDTSVFRTILFTDIESSSALTQRLGDARAQEVLRAHDTIVRDALAASGGSEIKHTGDGIMASLPSASGALECAIAIQRAVERNKEHGTGNTGDDLRVRIGLNAGEPVAERDDLFGTAVQLARRVCDQAQGGEILVSDVVRQLAAGKGFLFADRGNAALKGFDEPLRVFEVRWREDDV